MARITQEIQQATGEVERLIDRANRAPAVEAAVCCDSGTKEIGHVGNAFLLSRNQCAGTGVLFCHTDAATVARSTAAMIATETPALTCTHSLASIFEAVNTRSAALGPCADSASDRPRQTARNRASGVQASP
jgi:glycosyltransferase A (GT-A) superfamily protein (DUF2064 family)